MCPDCGNSLYFNSINVFSNSGVVTSTNFPNNYPNNHKKTQTIRVGEGFIMRLKFTAFDVESHSDCRYDHLVIKDGDGTTLMEKMCGTTLPTDIVSKSNIVKLHFTTDRDTTKPGWSVTWTARKPGNLEDHFLSPGHIITITSHLPFSHPLPCSSHHRVQLRGGSSR